MTQFSLRCRRWMVRRVALAIAPLVVACAAAVPASEVSQMVAVEGVLLIVYGDPVGRSGSPGYLFALTEPSGETHQVVPDSAAGMTAEILRGFDRQRVRAMGMFRPEPGSEFVVRRVEPLPGGTSAPGDAPSIP